MAKKKNSIYNKVRRDLISGGKLANDRGFNDPLTRISTEIPDDQKRYLEALRAMSDPSSAAFVGRRSQDMQDVLALMKDGLAGLNSRENQALREQAQQEVDRKRQFAIDQATVQARQGNMRGGAFNAANRTANRDAMQSQADMEQKNLLANVKVQDDRRTSYVDKLGGAEKDEFERTNTVMGDYGLGLDNRNRDWLERTKVNLGQERTERAAKVASNTGMAGLLEQERQKREDKKRRRGQSSNSSTSTGDAYDPMSKYEEIKKIYDNAGITT